MKNFIIVVTMLAFGLLISPILWDLYKETSQIGQVQKQVEPKEEPKRMSREEIHERLTELKEQDLRKQGLRKQKLKERHKTLIDEKQREFEDRIEEIIGVKNGKRKKTKAHENRKKQ